MSKSDLIIPKPEKRTREQLIRLQSLPLVQKENLSTRRVVQFSVEMGGKIYVAFSGGKDSTVLLHLVRKAFPDKIIVAVFCQTGLEYPEIIDFIKTVDNVDYVFPKMSFVKVLEKYGYPIISKENSQKIDEIRNTKSEKLRNTRLFGDEKGHGQLPLIWQPMIKAPFKISDKCCDILKKNPSIEYEKLTGLSPIIGKMADESRLREGDWLKYGCNMFDSKRPTSNPLMFWKESDIWEYIKKYNLKYSSVYDHGEERTGCMFCLFGCQFDSVDGRQRFDRMKVNYPKHYKACENLGVIKALNYLDYYLGRDQMELF